jgi:hypothetical protein
MKKVLKTHLRINRKINLEIQQVNCVWVFCMLSVGNWLTSLLYPILIAFLTYYTDFDKQPP